MLDFDLNLRAVDKHYIIFALRRVLYQLEDNPNKDRGGFSEHNYDGFYKITPVKEIA